MTRMKTFLLAAALAPIGAAPVAAQQQREPWPGYDAYVTAAMATWKVPGAAIAIVRNDTAIYAKGYGLRDIGRRHPAGERTTFAIGPATTAVTAAAAANAVAQRK